VKATERQREIERLGARLDPNLREFLDRVVVPLLVRKYLREHEDVNRVANPAKAVRQFQSYDAGRIQ
jgi:hypothetical protein